MPGQPDRRLLHALIAGALALALWLAAGFGLLLAGLPAESRELVASRAPLLLLVWAAGVVGWLFLLQRWWERQVLPLRRLAEQGRLLALPRAAVRPESSTMTLVSIEQRDLQTVLHELATRAEGLQRELTERVAEASRKVEAERRQLAQLMTELGQAVVVCNAAGRILLYNPLARMQLMALGHEVGQTAGAELVGLGRSIYRILDRRLVAHALARAADRKARGSAQAAAEFLTATRGGQWLRVRLSSVDAAVDGPPGFILLFENVTRRHQRERERGRALVELAARQRAALAGLHAASEMLALPGLTEADQQNFLRVVEEERARLLELTTALEALSSGAGGEHWPLETLLGEDLLAATAARLEAAGLRCLVQPGEARWLAADAHGLMLALEHLARRLAADCAASGFELALGPASMAGHLHLDLRWQGQLPEAAGLSHWQQEALGADAGELNIAAVLERHGAELWLERAPAALRLLLPAATVEAAEAAPARIEERPESWDFALYDEAEYLGEWADLPLERLRYSVFDTETTGLAVERDDELVQIAAVRIVGGRLLRHECFEQLVDPGRSLPAASTAIHGIQPEMLVGQPRPEQVLPAFHDFVADSVLVAHNAAFDLKCLRKYQRRTGLSFEQPVLDTLLLSALVQPNADSHRLDAIAGRFGVAVVGRHTALGDALVTAEVLLRLIPLLAGQGIRTLGEAWAASKQVLESRRGL